MALPEDASIPAPVISTERDNARGAVWMMMSVVTAACMTVAVRWASADMTSSLIVFMRSAGGLALALAAFAVFPGLKGQMRFTAPWLHIWRGCLIGVSTQLGFYTISQIPLATATVLFFSAPIFAALIAIPLHGETVGFRRGGAIAAGFVGVLIVLRPGMIPFDLAMLSAIASSFLFALALLSSRGLANKDGAFAAYVSSAVVTIVVSAPLALTHWSLPSTAWIWGALGLVVVMSLARNIGDLQAYRLAEASVLAPLSYLRLILIAIAGYVLFAEQPDIFTVTGGIVISAAALYIAHRERLIRRKPA